MAPVERVYRIGFSRVISNQWNTPREWSETLIKGSLEIEFRKDADGSQYAIALPERAAPIEILKLERQRAEARSKARESRNSPKTDDTPHPPPHDKPSEPLSEPPPSEREPDAKTESEESANP